ncbi:hypothetical protein Bca52824_001790 [Brassica carinata]|uniref:Phosphoacetylglucosamine mutase AMG1 domain-containing protein n=1 Tax=Brassica carinata TaxID=52824 RepID=A0A8X8BD69_BRACI|nr:hypothetical protein Bca52824_001790 [Brassica carinata]
MFVQEEYDQYMLDAYDLTTEHEVVQNEEDGEWQVQEEQELGLKEYDNCLMKFLVGEVAEFDVGIYFEANGRGTILFSEDYVSLLVGKRKDLSEGSDEYNAVSMLVAVSSLINKAVGDAIRGLLLVEVILQHMGWSVQKWNELYKDLPSRQVKVEVPDRTAVVTTRGETEALRPLGIQDAIDGKIKKYKRGRAFCIV